MLLGHVGLLPTESSAYEFRCGRHSLELSTEIAENYQREFKEDKEEGVSGRDGMPEAA